MCGSPASGKSTFYWTKLKPLGYERVNQDTLKTRDKCVKVATSFLAEGTSVAIDNTNADRDTRAVWITLAAKYKIPIRCIHFTAPAKLCEHNGTIRALASKDASGEFNPEKRTILPHSAFASFCVEVQGAKANRRFSRYCEGGVPGTHSPLAGPKMSAEDVHIHSFRGTKSRNVSGADTGSESYPSLVVLDVYGLRPILQLKEHELSP